MRSAEHHVSISSTQDRARVAAGEDHLLPRLIIADEQTAGRGRGNHSWWSGHGNLTFSLLCDIEPVTAVPSEIASVSLVIGAAVVAATCPLLTGNRVGLCWPNDVFVEGKKIAGILIERMSDGRTIIGIGVNTNHSISAAPEEVQRLATSFIDQTGQVLNHMQFLEMLLTEIESYLQLARVESETVHNRLDEMCMQKGEQLAISLGSETIRGTCLGISASGGLLLQTDNGEREFLTGTIVQS